MKIHKVGGLGAGSNIYFIPDETPTLIDAGTGLEFDRMKRKLENLDASLRDIDLLINTHCHIDHVGGDRELMKASGCVLAAHELAAKPLRSGDHVATLAASFDFDFKPLEVSRVLREGDRVELGNMTLKVLHTPGHSEGCISLYEPSEKVLFSGDAVFRMGIGRMDLPTSGPGAMKKSLQRLSKLEVEGLYPGHGPFAEKDGSRYIGMGLENSYHRVKMGPREFLNKLKWHPDLDLDEAKVTIVHRGAPRDKRVIDGSEIVGLGRGFMSVGSDEEEVKIPYHRILKIEVPNKELWRKGPR